MAFGNLVGREAINCECGDDAAVVVGKYNDRLILQIRPEYPFA